LKRALLPCIIALSIFLSYNGILHKARIFLTSVKIKVFNKTIRKYLGGEGVMACSKKCGTTKKTTKKPASKKK
jgi:hypothetical protein